MTDKNNSWQLVDSQDSLDTLTQQVTKADWVAVDTEFMREKTYHPVLCLLQIATPEWAACVDPQADIDLSGFLNALYRPDLTKVFHAAEQDLELFNQLKGSPPPNLFDSQIAAPLLGFPEQAGYGRLVELICGRILDKSQSRTDWSRRPLSGQQLQYAADDVIELVKIYQHLTKELAATGRDEWLTPEWEKLADPERFNRSPDRAWERLKNLDRLSAKSRGAAQQIAIWREKQAKERNLPRNWVLKDPILFDLAKQLPKNWDSLTRLRGLPDGILKRDGETLLKLVADGQNNPFPLTKKPRPRALDEGQLAIADALSAIVRLKAHQHNINAQVLASRKDIESYVCGKPGNLEEGWRSQLLGGALQRFISGELSLRVNEDIELTID